MADGSASTSDSRLRWGILGTGNIARQFAAGMATSRRGTLAAVASRDGAAAEAFAKTHGVEQAYGAYDTLLRDRKVDAVYVSLPNSMHHAWTVRALRVGKHVLCEKPFAANLGQAEEMVDVARAEGRVVMEALMYRSHPLTEAVLADVRGGRIGELKLIRTSFCFRTSRVAGNIRFDPRLAGGALMDVGCYCLSLSRLLAGREPTGFDVTGRLHETGVDELAAGTLTFDTGVVATFACGLGVQADNSAWVCGTDGYLHIPVPWKPPRENAQYTIAHSNPPKMDGGPTRPPPPQTHAISVPTDLYALEADDFAAAVLDGAPVRVTPEDTLGNMRLLDEMRRRLGVPV